jgi:hypothetical protein
MIYLIQLIKEHLTLWHPLNVDRAQQRLGHLTPLRSDDYRSCFVQKLT